VFCHESPPAIYTRCFGPMEEIRHNILESGDSAMDAAGEAAGRVVAMAFARALLTVVRRAVTQPDAVGYLDAFADWRDPRTPSSESCRRASSRGRVPTMSAVAGSRTVPGRRHRSR